MKLRGFEKKEIVLASMPWCDRISLRRRFSWRLGIGQGCDCNFVNYFSMCIPTERDVFLARKIEMLIKTYESLCNLRFEPLSVPPTSDFGGLICN